jgi:hypothetical protein
LFPAAIALRVRAKYAAQNRLSGRPSHALRSFDLASLSKAITMIRNSLLCSFSFAALALCTAPSATADTCALKNLRWLEGTWRDSDKDSAAEERWVEGPNGRLIGSSWALHKDTPAGVIEAMALLEEEGRLVMRLRHFDSTLARAREDKDAPMLFVATNCSRNSLTLEGTGDQSGERFVYTRDGKQLKFIGDFVHQGKPLHVELKFSAAAGS